MSYQEFLDNYKILDNVFSDFLLDDCNILRFLEWEYDPKDVLDEAMIEIDRVYRFFRNHHNFDQFRNSIKAINNCSEVYQVELGDGTMTDSKNVIRDMLKLYQFDCCNNVMDKVTKAFINKF